MRAWPETHQRWLAGGCAVLLLSLCAAGCLGALLLPMPSAKGAKGFSGVCVDPEWLAWGPAMRVTVWTNADPFSAFGMGTVGGCVNVPYQVWYLPPNTIRYWGWP